MAGKLTSMLEAAAGEGEEGAELEEGTDEEFDVEADEESEKKAAFLEMAQAISDGDFEAAWAAWKEYC